MDGTATKTRKPSRKFRLENRGDVIRYLSECIRSLRRLAVMDKDLDPIRITKQKTLVYALSKMAELLTAQGLEAATDDALLIELERRKRIEMELAHQRPEAPPPATPETH